MYPIAKASPMWLKFMAIDLLHSYVDSCITNKWDNYWSHYKVRKTALVNQDMVLKNLQGLKNFNPFIATHHRRRKRGGPGGPWPLLKFKAFQRNSIFAIEKF